MSEPLASLPAGVAEAFAVIDALDRCLEVGLQCIGEEGWSALQSVGESFAGTPLGDRLEAMSRALERGQVGSEEIACFAVVRGALQGAVHDALSLQLREALGRPVPEATAPTPDAPYPSASVPLVRAALQSLADVARVGLGAVGAAQVEELRTVAFSMRDDAALQRLGATLASFVEVVERSVPMQDPEQLPLRQWADLWSRSVLLCLGRPDPQGGEPVEGTFRVLGGVWRASPVVASLSTWGLFGEEGRLVRASCTAWILDQLILMGQGGMRGRMGVDAALPAALEQRRELRVSGRIRGGDLLIDEAELGGSWDWARDVQAFQPGEAAPCVYVEPADRHPLQIAELVYLEEATQSGDALECSLGTFPIVDPGTFGRTTIVGQVLGVLTWVDRWVIVPLAASVKKDERGQAFTLRAGSEEGKYYSFDRFQRLASIVLREKS